MPYERNNLRTGDEYDYIIVGAGSAGCVLANRLSIDPACRVLLIEAGPSDSHSLIGMPMGIGKTLANGKLNWYYATEPEPGNQHRARVWIRGKTLGGSSSVNGMMYMRGQPQDYDHWEQLGNEGWGWREMGRCFRQMENHELGADEHRGIGGPLHISIQSHRSRLTEAMLEAGIGLGLVRKEDINRPEQEGIGYTPVTIKGGARVSASDAFLKPIRSRKNLHIVTDTLVEKVVFDGRRAIAVACMRAGSAIRYRCRQEIILCAGALESPKLLQLSGIGPAQLLQDLGIAVLEDNVNVGAHLREHKTLTLQLELHEPYSHNVSLRGVRLAANALRYFLTKSGPLASTYDVTAFIRTNPNLDRPDAQLTFWSLTWDRTAQSMRLDSAPGMTIMGYPLRTESEGSVKLRSADASAPPIVATNFLAAPYDRQVIVDMFRYMRRFAAQEELAAFISKETWPGVAIQTDAEILDACRADDTCMHAVGTCKMGVDRTAVVDPQLRVIGVEGLRVMDCSVMPTQVSGNTNGPVMAMAWRAAERIVATSASRRASGDQ